MRKMRSNRSSPVAPVAAEGAMTMAQMVEIMRSLQANVEASRIEQAVEDGCCPFKIVFDEDLYVVFDEDFYVLFMYFCFALSVS